MSHITMEASFLVIYISQLCERLIANMLEAEMKAVKVNMGACQKLSCEETEYVHIVHCGFIQESVERKKP